MIQAFIAFLAPALWAFAAFLASAGKSDAWFTAAHVLAIVGFILTAEWVAYFAIKSEISHVARSLILATVAAVLVLSVYWTYFVIDATHKSAIPKLWPASESDPPRPKDCEPSEDAVVVYAGTNVAWSEVLPYIVLEIDGRAAIEADRGTKGEFILKTLRLFDEQNEILARFTDRQYWRADSVRTARPDPHTLVVYDRADQEVLRVRLVNRKSLVIAGVFHRQNRPSIVITENELILPPGTFQESCFANNRAAFCVNGDDFGIGCS